MTELLRIDQVVKRYNNHLALDHVSMSVPRLSVFGLLGPNGAGKTSLIRIINQITAPDSGEVYFMGEKLRPSHVERIGYLPEERGLYKKMTVFDQVLYLARLKGLSAAEAKKRIDYWFARFEMNAWRKKKIEELSKGMQQKVQFIVTVIHQPDLLILDEPFSGFDPINAQIIRNEILELRNKGATVIFSTHNMGSVEELCDYITLLDKSKKILEGSVKEIRNTYKSNTYKITFAGAFDVLDAQVSKFGRNLAQNEDGDLKIMTIQLAADTNINLVLQSILPHCELHGLQEMVPGMNDIFIMKVQQGTGAFVPNNNFTE